MAQVILCVYPIFSKIFSPIFVCFINFHEYANSIICMIGIKVKLLKSMLHYQTNLSIVLHAIVGI